MKNKLFLFICLIAFVFSFTACKSKNSDNNVVERESKKNQIGYVEGKYNLKNLTFTLPDVYKDEGDNSYSYIGDGNGIRVMLSLKENYNGTIDEFMNKDEEKLYPNIKSMEEKIINGNSWLKGKSTDNDTLYYIKDGNDLYTIDIAPLFTTQSVFNELVTTLENSLYFK